VVAVNGVKEAEPLSQLTGGVEDAGLYRPRWTSEDVTDRGNGKAFGVAQQEGAASLRVEVLQFLGQSLTEAFHIEVITWR
jgi:hypothetical protein